MQPESIPYSITLDKAEESDQSVVQNLARFYTYEMSRYCGLLPGWETPEDGLYSCFDDEYTSGQFEQTQKIVQEPKPHPMLVMKFRSNHASQS